MVNTRKLKPTRSLSYLCCSWLTVALTTLTAGEPTNITNRAQALARLIAAYPDHFEVTSAPELVWRDGTRMPLTLPVLAATDTAQLGDVQRSLAEKLNNPTLLDQLEQPVYIPGRPTTVPQTDPGRIRYEPFFRKMYGNSPAEVEAKLVRVAWLPKVFGAAARLLAVTTVNQIHEKIAAIAAELEELVQQHPEYTEFLAKPGGTYCWRKIAGTERLSNHSFGMTLDINPAITQYWQWDLKAAQQLVSEETPLNYRNTVPWEIVEIFEKYGFIWGGKWYHYDTMHFEYRPELMVVS